MRRFEAGLLLAVALLLAGSAATAGEQSERPRAGVASPSMVQVTGFSTIDASEGALMVRPSEHLASVRLDAQEVMIETAWERGVEIRSGGTSVAKHVTDRGRDGESLSDVQVLFDLLPGSDASILFSYAMNAQTSLSATFVTDLDLAAIHNHTAVAVGTSPKELAAGAEPGIGFWHTIEHAVTRAEGSGVVEVEGTFQLFVHDVWIEAEEDSGTKWSDWTGYREEPRGGGATEYELRVTTMTVKGGTFSAMSDDSMELYLPALDITLDGHVAMSRATGQLVHGQTVYMFENDPLALRGQGNVSVRAQAGSEQDTELSPYLWLRPSRSFEVHGASRITQVGGAETASPLLKGAPAASLGGLALFSTLGLMVMGIVPAPTRGLRRRQSERCMRRGYDAADCDEWSRAALYFRRATRMQRQDPLPWYEWAHAELCRGDGELAEDIARRGGQVPGMDRLDLLDLRASAAWQRGDHAAFEEHLAHLAEGSPGMAHRLLVDLKVDPARLKTPLPGPSNVPRHDGGLDGYA